MTSPLLSSLKATVGSAFSGLFMDATLTRTTITPGADAFDPLTGTQTTSTYSCKAIHDQWSFGYKRDGLITSEDIKILILAASLSVEPQPGDRITIIDRGLTATIVPADTAGQAAVETDPAKATWTCRCRK